jgi:hypothetical protein
MLSIDKIKTDWVDEKFSKIIVIDINSKESITVGSEIFNVPFRSLWFIEDLKMFCQNAACIFRLDLVIPQVNKKFACFLNEDHANFECNPDEKTIFSINNIKEPKCLFYISH